MIILSNSILRNIDGYFSTLQDGDAGIKISVFHIAKLGDDQIEAIGRIVLEDQKSGKLTKRSIMEAIIAGDNAPKELKITYYFEYVDEFRIASFVLFIGEEPEYFHFERMRSEFPDAEMSVYGLWGCRTHWANGWRIYYLPHLFKERFTSVACKTELFPDELYLVLRGYIAAVEAKDGEELTVNDVSEGIRKVSGVSWHNRRINLPEVLSMHEGSVLLELAVHNNRNFYLAES